MRVGGISYTLLGPVLYALLVYGLRGRAGGGLLLALAGLVPPVVLPCLIPNFTSGAIAGLSGAAVVLTAAWKGWMGGAPEEGGSRRGRWAPGIEQGPRCGICLKALMRWSGSDSPSTRSWTPWGWDISP